MGSIAKLCNIGNCKQPILQRLLTIATIALGCIYSCCTAAM